MSEASEAVQKMLKKAMAQLGKGGDMFNKWVGNSSGTAWCATFVCWVVYQGFGSNYTKYITKTAVATIPRDSVNAGKATWVKKPGESKCTTPQPGDIWAKYSCGSNYGHTGLVYSVDTKNKMITTIEGNWSNRVASNKFPYSKFYCIARPKWGKVGKITGDDEEGSGVDMQQAIQKLFSSDNFKYVDREEKVDTESAMYKFKSALQSSIKNLSNTNFSSNGATSESLANLYNNLISTSETTKKKQKLTTITDLVSFPTLVEAPIVEVSFNGITIGGYGNSGDKYPNYISSMEIQKTNGKINQYTINIIHQIRPGEDPNTIDRLLSRTGYRNTLKIKYGDSNYSMLFKEDQAIINDATQSEDPTSSTITYTIKAVSSVDMIDNMYYTFPSVSEKPSSVIYNLLYNNPQTSSILLEGFSGMQDKNKVIEKGLIPTTDSIVNIGGMNDVQITDYLTHVVSTMTNSNLTSSYYLNYVDDYSTDLNGSYFKISEVTNTQSLSTSLEKGLYSIDVGYPGNNFVISFNLNENAYWPIVYEYNSTLPYYNYDIDNNGNISKNSTLSLYKNSKYQTSGIVEENWWKNVTEFPVTATLTLKGLIKPVILTSYIYINALFYGKQDLASGLYTVTGQTDELSSSGYTTTLTLLRTASS